MTVEALLANEVQRLYEVFYGVEIWWETDGKEVSLRASYGEQNFAVIQNREDDLQALVQRMGQTLERAMRRWKVPLV